MTLIQTGTRIPNDQLCLTFDDGPGPHTAEISNYLKSEGICATFFLIGAHVAANPRAVQQLVIDGHEIGNHSQTHARLTEPPYDAAREISAAHEQLRPFVANQERPLFFRPPFGFWPTLPNLNEARTSLGERLGDLYAGPICWDFSGDDWSYWENARSADDPQALLSAMNHYFHVSRGIVLMHDHSQNALVAGNNQTYLMIKGLIPAWKSRGYSFISLRDAYRAGYLDVYM